MRDSVAVEGLAVAAAAARYASRHTCCRRRRRRRWLHVEVVEGAQPSSDVWHEARIAHLYGRAA
jgi:hypothetical protein